MVLDEWKARCNDSINTSNNRKINFKKKKNENKQEELHLEVDCLIWQISMKNYFKYIGYNNSIQW